MVICAGISNRSEVELADNGGLIYAASDMRGLLFLSEQGECVRRRVVVME